MPVIRTSSGITYNIIRIRHVLRTYIQYTMDITSKNTLGEAKNIQSFTGTEKLGSISYTDEYMRNVYVPYQYVLISNIHCLRTC